MCKSEGMHIKIKINFVDSWGMFSAFLFVGMRKKECNENYKNIRNHSGCLWIWHDSLVKCFIENFTSISKIQIISWTKKVA